MIEIKNASHGQCWESLGNWPSRMLVVQRGAVELGDEGTHFGFIATGSAKLTTDQGAFQLQEGMYYAVAGTHRLECDGSGFVVTRIGWFGFFQIGGPIENEGRLRYIDGCSDSLLIAPVVLGAPCLNLLFLPPGTCQTEHTHPSVRFGMIVSGWGTCKTPGQDYSLAPGMSFYIPENQRHSFHTDDESLRVIAWHPDSDFGPTDDHHPMINRTMIDGISAARRLTPDH